MVYLEELGDIVVRLPSSHGIRDLGLQHVQQDSKCLSLEGLLQRRGVLKQEEPALGDVEVEVSLEGAEEDIVLDQSPLHAELGDEPVHEMTEDYRRQEVVIGVLDPDFDMFKLLAFGGVTTEETVEMDGKDGCLLGKEEGLGLHILRQRLEGSEEILPLGDVCEVLDVFQHIVLHFPPEGEKTLLVGGAGVTRHSHQSASPQQGGDYLK